MKWAFLFSGLIEFIGGIVSYMYPDLIFRDNHILSDIFGLNAIVVGIINLILFRYFEKSTAFKFIALAMMFMHGGQAMICYRAIAEQFPYHMGGMITHLLLFIVFLVCYMQQIEPQKN